MTSVYIILIFIIVFCIAKKTGLLAGLHESTYVAFLVRYTEKYNGLTAPYKKELFQELHDIAKERKKPLRLLEIGPGNGSNFIFYPKSVDMVCIEPKEKFKQHLEKNAKKDLEPVSLKIVQDYANDLEMFESDSFDAVIITMVMCSIDDHGRLLAAVKRVLKPGCKLYYLEHVRGEGWLLGLQYMLKPLWFYMFDGCTHTKDTWRSVENAGFSSVDQHRFMAPMPLNYLPLRPQLMGKATK